MLLNSILNQIFVGIVLCIGLTACNSERPEEIVLPGETYELHDQQGTLVGTVNVKADGRYVLEYKTGICWVEGLHDIIVVRKTIGRVIQTATDIFMNDQIDAELVFYNRWGVELLLDEQQMFQFRKDYPRSDCRKVTVSNGVLIEI